MGNRIIPEVKGYTKRDVMGFIRMKLKSNDIWAKKACVSLYEQQTEWEKKNHISNGHNNVGFDRNDSPLLTGIACRIVKHQETIKDIERLKKMIWHYAAQLVCLAQAKDGCKSLRKHLDFYYKDVKKNIPY